jgi:hypothetical protein
VCESRRDKERKYVWVGDENFQIVMFLCMRSKGEKERNLEASACMEGEF